MDFSKLERLGLTRGESKVYLVLLEKGESKAGILAEETGLNRTTVYKSLESLTRKGLTAYAIKENRKYFVPTNPKNLDIYLQERKNEITKRREHLREILDDLEGLFLQKEENTQISIYKGYRGLKSLFNDITRETKNEYLAMGVPEHAEIFYEYFEEFNKELAKRKIKRRIIFEKTAKRNIESCIKYGYAVSIVDRKFLSPSEVNIYGEKVALVIWEKVPFAIVIKNKEVAESFRSYFELLWRISRKK